MTLPEIPAEAYASGAAHVGGWDCDPDTSAAMVLEAAWPHLYAAALRHAADICDAEIIPPGIKGGLSSSRITRRLADEATAE